MDSTLPILAPGKYKHYKGKLYEVIGIGTHSESLDSFVVYKPLYENSESEFWIRPYAMFVESVVVDGKLVPRFEKIED